MLVELWNAFIGYVLDVLHNMDWWVVLGFTAQALFAARFFVQWVASERAGKSIMPVAFWYFSISGGLLLLIYALYRKDPVFIAGQALSMFVYLRNLHLVLREQRAMETRAR